MSIVRLIRRWLDRYYPDERLISSEQLNERLAGTLWSVSVELQRTRQALQRGLTGDCELHADLPHGEFARRGGYQCPICLSEKP